MASPTCPRDHSADFDRAYFDHARMVRRVLRRLGVPTHQLDDATQDVFLAFVRRRRDYDPHYPLRAWLRGIARGVASTHRRTAARRARLRARVTTEHVVRSTPASDPERCTHDRLVLIRSMANLDSDARRLFELAEVHGLAGHDIARRLDLNVNTVYARIRAVRKRLLHLTGGESVRSVGQALTVLLLGLSLRRLLRSPVYSVAATSCAWVLSWAVLEAQPDPVAQTNPVLADRHVPPLFDHPSSFDVSARHVASTTSSIPPATRIQTAGQSEEKDQVTSNKDSPMLSAPLVYALALTTPSPSPPVVDSTAPSAEDADDRADRGRQGDARRYVFDDDDVAGALDSPDDLRIVAPVRMQHPSLLTLRRHFIDQLILLSEDI